VTTPSTAAVRLLGLDPTAVQRLTASLTDLVEATAAEALAAADRALADLPGATSTLVDLRAHRHATQEGRLFAS
jgi:urease accessory protein